MAEPKIPGGYYIKSRKIQESAISKQPPHVREIWDYLLRNANHADSVLTGGRKIKRGQLFRRHKRIIDDLSWVVGWRKESYNENHVKKAMKFLREALMIDTMKEPGGVLITVLNYDKYQDPKNYERTSEGTNERTIEEPMKNQCVPTYDKKKEEYKEEEIKEGEKNDNMEYVGIGSVNSTVFSYHYKSLKLGHWESDSNRIQEINGQSAEVSRSGDNNGNNSVDLLPCNGTNLSWSDLNGQPGQLSQTTLDNSGQGINDNLFVSNSGGDIWDSQNMPGFCSSEAMGGKDTSMDRNEDEQEVIINDGMGAQAEDAPEPPQKGAKAKKGKPKNGVQLDLSTLDPRLDKAIVEKFIEYRKTDKKKPVDTQRKLDGITNAALACNDIYGYDPNTCLLYTMQAGANGGWLLPKPEYFKNEDISFKIFSNKSQGIKIERHENNDLLTPLERKNKENAEIATKMLEKLFDEKGRFTGIF